MIRRALLSTSLPLCLAACQPGDRARAAGADTTRGVAIDPSTSAGQIALELWQLRGGVTLGDWKGVHPDEPILGADTSVLAAQYLGEWCGFAARHARVGRRTLVRAAYFYAPPPPADLAVPDSGAPDLARRCVLGLVWVSLEVRDSAAGAALADSLRTGLRGVFGAPAPGSVSFWGSAWWSHTARFRRDSLVAVSALRVSQPPVAGDTTQRRRSVVAFAFLPSAGISVDTATPLAERGWMPIDTFPLDSAAQSAALDTLLYGRLRAVARASTEPSREAPAESLIAPLVRWLAASAALPAPRRAAALYVADQVLDRALCRHRLCDRQSGPALAPLRTRGAQFTWSELGGTMVYQHSWLAQARNLDRDSPLGQRILLAQLAVGLDFSGICAGGAEGFRRVVDTGERYLERVPQSPIAPDVHYLTAEAYRDIVALAHGAGGIYADSSRYGGEAQEAARKALEHYGAAVRAGAGSAAARAAWRRAWWLRAGLVPRDLRFYCVYD